MRLLMFVILFVSSTLCVAQPCYQTQAFVRAPGSLVRPGLIQILVPEALEQFSYRAPGESEMRLERNAMRLFDKRNSLMPIQAAGSNYFFLQNGHLATLSASGSLFYHGKVDLEPSVVGGVYFVDSHTGELHVVDAFGYWMPTGIHPGPIRVVGGNYFITHAGLLTTIKCSGAAPGNPVGAAIEKTGWDFSQVRSAGGTFFVRQDGGVVSIDSETGFFQEAVFPDSVPELLGGNFFIGRDGILYTLSASGKIFKNPGITVGPTPRLLGPSFIQRVNGSLIAVDSGGIPHQRLVRVSTTGARIETVQKFESDPDPRAVFAPSIQEPGRLK